MRQNARPHCNLPCGAAAPVILSAVGTTRPSDARNLRRACLLGRQPAACAAGWARFWYSDSLFGGEAAFHYSALHCPVTDPAHCAGLDFGGRPAVSPGTGCRLPARRQYPR